MPHWSLLCSTSISLFRAVSSALRNDVISLIEGSFVYLILLVMGGFILPRCELAIAGNIACHAQLHGDSDSNVMSYGKKDWNDHVDKLARHSRKLIELQTAVDRTRPSGHSQYALLVLTLCLARAC